MFMTMMMIKAKDKANLLSDKNNPIVILPHMNHLRCWGIRVLLHFAWVVDDAKCIVVTRVCVSVCLCLSAAVGPHYCTDPDVTWGRGRGCPLVMHYWADMQSGHGLRCYGNTKRTLVTSLRPSRDITT